ncbi:MAG: hypothetical protein PHD37_03290 [Gallionellaceae bacterium]|nr:hypothetical protein [Gallionellaceae bacterium]
MRVHVLVVFFALVNASLAQDLSIIKKTYAPDSAKARLEYLATEPTENWRPIFTKSKQSVPIQVLDTNNITIDDQLSKIKPPGVKYRTPNYAPSQVVDGPSYEFGSKESLKDYLTPENTMERVLDLARSYQCNDEIGPFKTSLDMVNSSFSTSLGQTWSPWFWNYIRENNIQPIRARAMQKYRSAQSAFKNACLSRDAVGMTADQKTQIISVIGFFRSSDEGTYCTGTRIARDLVISAAHCFFDVRKGWARYSRTDQSRFHLAVDKVGYPFELVSCTLGEDGQSCNSLTAKAKDDHIIVRLRPDPGITLPQFTHLSTDTPKEGDRLVLVGYATQFEGEDITDPLHYLGTSEQYPGCVIKSTMGGCIHHGCQAFEGYSGAAIFRRDKQHGLTILGIHLGTDGPAVDGGECSANRQQLGNLGYSISPTVASILAK